MKTNALRLLLGAFLLATLILNKVYGWASTLEQPSLSFPADFKDSEAVMRVLTDKKFSFIGGSYINAHSTLLYSGKAHDLNEFLVRLAACPTMQLSVSFSEDVEVAEAQEKAEISGNILGEFAGERSEASWKISHNGWINPNSIHVTVKSGMIKKADIKVPEAQ